MNILTIRGLNSYLRIKLGIPKTFQIPQVIPNMTCLLVAADDVWRLLEPYMAPGKR